MSESDPKSRRRWLTLAEVVGVLALVISSVTLWNNVSMRRGQEADRLEEKAKSQTAERWASRERTLVTLTGSPTSGGSQLVLSDGADHAVQSVDIWFPPSLGMPRQNAVLEPRIDADWIARPVLAITDGGADLIEGRLPVAITSTFWQGDVRQADTAIYDLVFTTEGQVIGGRRLRLKGVVLRERVADVDPARLDTLWAAERKRLGV